MLTLCFRRAIVQVMSVEHRTINAESCRRFNLMHINFILLPVSEISDPQTERDSWIFSHKMHSVLTIPLLDFYLVIIPLFLSETY